jgi:hypothetical protein
VFEFRALLDATAIAFWIPIEGIASIETRDVMLRPPLPKIVKTIKATKRFSNAMAISQNIVTTNSRLNDDLTINSVLQENATMISLEIA